MAVYETVILDQNNLPVAGALGYIYVNGALAALTDDLGAPIGNPIITDANGNAKATVPSWNYIVRWYWGGTERLVEEKNEGLDPTVTQVEALVASASNSAAYAEAMTGPTYASTAAGLAATTNGQGFAVNNGDDTITVYINQGGVAVAQRTLGNTYHMPSRAALAAMGSTDGRVAYLSETGREGFFRFSSANLSASVTADPRQGIYVAKSSDPTGASGAWVRAVDGPHNVKWFGAVGDNVTNDGPAFLAAIAYLKSEILPSGFGFGRGSPSLFVPAGQYFLGTNTLDFDFTMRLFGEGTGLPGAGISVLRWAAGATGLRTQAYNTTGADGIRTPETGNPTGSGCVFEGLFLKGGYASDGVEAEEHGVHLRAMALIRDCYIHGFRGNGIHLVASAGAGAPNEGNGNLSRIENVTIGGCRIGIYTDLADSNACTFSHINCSANRTWGFYDSSFLGNTYIGCHTAANGWDGALNSIPTACTYSGNRYYVKVGQAVDASTNPPTGTTADNKWWGYIGAGGTYNGIIAWTSGATFREGGSYKTDGANAQNVFVGCYHETDQSPIQAVSPTLFIGGLTGTISGGAAGITSNNGAATSRQGFQVTDTSSNAIGIKMASGLYFAHTTKGNYSLQYNNNDLVWTIANSTLSSNWAFKLTGEGTTSPIGARRLDFPNGFGLAGKKILSGTAAPSSGTFAVGDMVFNSAAAAAGKIGFVCTTAGDAATTAVFKPFGAIDA